MVSVILDLLGGIGGLVTAVLGLVGAVFAALWSRERGKRKDAEGYRDTRKEIDDAMEGLPRDPDAARDWLRERMRNHNKR